MKMGGVDIGGKKTAGRPGGGAPPCGRMASGLVHAVHVAHAAGGGGGRGVLLGDVGDHGFRHQQEAGDGGGVLEGAAGESGWERMPALSMSTYSPVATL